MARAYRPNSVFDKSAADVIVSRTYDPTNTGLLENAVAKDDPRSNQHPRSILEFALSQRARPRMPIMLARVTTNGWRFQRAMTNPLIRPTNPALKTASSAATKIPIAPVKGRAAVVTSRADNDDASARIVPTLKSMPPVMITKVMPSEMIPISETCLKMSVRFPNWRKTNPPRGARGLMMRARTIRPARPIPLCNRLRSALFWLAAAVSARSGGAELPLMDAGAGDRGSERGSRAVWRARPFLQKCRRKR